MQNRFFRSIGKFFEGAGSVLSTPSGDARGHVNVPIDTMYDVSSGPRWVGRSGERPRRHRPAFSPSATPPFALRQTKGPLTPWFRPEHQGSRVRGLSLW